jgi:AcrR family transcriptional regulator
VTAASEVRRRGEPRTTPAADFEPLPSARLRAATRAVSCPNASKSTIGYAPLAGKFLVTAFRGAEAKVSVEQLGLRERKKEKTRELIAETARELFVERGFDAVTVVEIARAADVAEKTVYNYFPTKEDLVYSRMEAFEERLLDAVRERGPGQSALAAFAEFMDETYAVLAERAATGELKAITRVITNSRALLAREQQVFGRYTASLAALLAEETRTKPDDVKPWVAANALMGVHRAIIDYVRRRTLAGASGARLAREVETQTKDALAALEGGLADYALKRARGGVRRRR